MRVVVTCVAAGNRRHSLGLNELREYVLELCFLLEVSKRMESEYNELWWIFTPVVFALLPNVRHLILLGGVVENNH